jgi:hypothetical protein
MVAWLMKARIEVPQSVMRVVICGIDDGQLNLRFVFNS